MFETLPQFVPQDVCLKCDGCCRFDSPESVWRPKAGADELYAWEREKTAQAPRLLVKADGHLPTKDFKAPGRQCKCVFFDELNNACRVYEYRPFECRLYPFVLTRRGSEVVLGFHWACPHMQDAFGSDGYKAYIDELKAFFTREDVRQFLRHNRHLVSGYEQYAQEIEEICVIDIGAASVVDGLMSRRLLLNDQVRAEQLPLSTAEAGSLIAWKDFFDIDIREIGGAVCVFFTNEAGCFMPLPPLTSTLEDDLVQECFSIMNLVNANPDISRVENVSGARLKQFNDHKYRYTVKGHEFIYYKRDLINLAGQEYKSKRSDYNHFTASVAGCVYRPFADGDAEQCLALYDRWAESRRQVHEDDIYRHMLGENRRVHAVLMENWRGLGLTGRVAVINGNVAAYTFGFPLGERSFCVAAEVADLAFKGLPVFIFREFCRDEALAPYDFINVMDDCLLPNISRTKASFRPVIMNASYTVALR